MSRRAFLDATGGCAVALIASMGLNTRDVLALPIVETIGERAGNEWRSVIPASDSVNIDHHALVILARAQGHVFVFNLACPHQNAAVKWLPTDNRFNVPNTIPSTRPTACTLPAARREISIASPSVETENFVVADLDRFNPVRQGCRRMGCRDDNRSEPGAGRFNATFRHHLRPVRPNHSRRQPFRRCRVGHSAPP